MVTPVAGEVVGARIGAFWPCPGFALAELAGAPALAAVTVLALVLVAGGILCRRNVRRRAKRIRDLEAELAQARAKHSELESRIAGLDQALKAAAASLEMSEESERRYRELFDNANDIIFLTDLQGNLLMVNKAALRITGYAPDEALTLNLFDLLGPEERDRFRLMIERKLGGEPATTYELTVPTKGNRKVTLEVNTRLIFDNGAPRRIQGIARDITERKRLEEQLNQSQKLEAVGRLAGGIAHDFNNVITVVWAYAQMLKDGLDQDETLQAFAKEIMLAAERASSLTTRLLAFSRKQIAEPKVIDLNAVLANLDNMLRRLIGEDIELVTTLSSSLGKVKADPAQIEQVVINLAVNARDAMPGGGTIVIETANVESRDLPAGVGLTGPCVKLAISDTGHGMTEEVRAHLFEPFFTTKAPGKGTGLGLSIVYGIVRQAGGYIHVASEPGNGSTFTVYLPEAVDTERAGGETSQRVSTRRPGETVVLVEDEPAVRKIVAQMLTDQGYRVLTAANGDECLELCERHKGSIHVLLTDVIMPRMSGRELAERVAPRHPGIKVLYMTGYTEDTIRQHGLDNDRVSMLAKPFNGAVLARKLRELLDGKNRR